MRSEQYGMDRRPLPRRARGAAAVALLLAVVSGCTNPPPGDGGAPPPDSGPGGPPATLPPAPPWAGAALPADAVPAVYLSEWRAAENRERCALVAPVDLGAGEGATPRAATFSGGWAVAYDQPSLRSAFGVAGTGASAEGPSYSEWPHSREWADGSRADYGPEGGSGPNQLAYLLISGQDCLYNVWSRLGVEHLEHLLDRLRFVVVE